ncbi:MAG: DUF4351 domain-containing protein [Deinococcales bacterium]
MLETEAIDHDQIFETLLESFFFEFVELFFPGLAQYVDVESLEPLSLKQITIWFNLTPAKTRLLSGFIDTYLRLNLTEQLTFERDLEALVPARKEKIVELTNSWEQKGIIIGIELGKIDLLMRQLKRKFKHIGVVEEELIQGLKVSELDDLAEVLLDLKDYSELQAYLAKPKQDKN